MEHRDDLDQHVRHFLPSLQNLAGCTGLAVSPGAEQSQLRVMPGTAVAAQNFLTDIATNTNLSQFWLAKRATHLGMVSA